MIGVTLMHTFDYNCDWIFLLHYKKD